MDGAYEVDGASGRIAAHISIKRPDTHTDTHTQTHTDTHTHTGSIFLPLWDGRTAAHHARGDIDADTHTHRQTQTELLSSGRAMRLNFGWVCARD